MEYRIVAALLVGSKWNCVAIADAPSFFALSSSFAAAAEPQIVEPIRNHQETADSSTARAEHYSPVNFGPSFHVI